MRIIQKNVWHTQRSVHPLCIVLRNKILLRIAFAAKSQSLIVIIAPPITLPDRTFVIFIVTEIWVTVKLVLLSKLVSSKCLKSIFDIYSAWSNGPPRLLSRTRRKNRTPSQVNPSSLTSTELPKASSTLLHAAVKKQLV